MRRFGVLLAALMTVTTASAQTADPSLSPQANAAFLAAYAKKPGVVVRLSGLEYRVLQNGYGAQPGDFDTVSVYYKGTLINGKVFDATEPGFPASFTVNGVIRGFTEALELMHEGDHWELVIPAALAYGARGAGGAVPPNQTLVFDVQLVKTTPPPPPPPDKDSGQ